VVYSAKKKCVFVVKQNRSVRKWGHLKAEERRKLGKKKGARGMINDDSSKTSAGCEQGKEK